MRNKKYECAGIIMAVAMLALSLLGSISFHGFNTKYYEKEYQKLHTATYLGMSEESLFEATHALLDYLNEKREDIVVHASVMGQEREVFNERETLHMVDVRNLWISVKKVVLVIACLGAISLLYLIFQWRYKKESLKNILYSLNLSFQQVTLAFILVVGFLIGYALIDFNAFWTAFHQIFFTNDLWLLDPATSIMINMFPESFFAGMVFRIALTFVLSYGLIWLLIRLFYRKIGINEPKTIA